MSGDHKTRVQRQIRVTDEFISDKQKKVDQYLEAYYKRFMALTQMDKNKSAQRYAIRDAAVNVGIAAISFVPIYGPVIGSVVSAAVNGATSGQKGVGMLTAALKFNLNAGKGMDQTHYANIGTLFFDPFKSANIDPQNQAMSKGLNDTVAASCNLLTPLLFPSKGQGGKGLIVKLPATSDILGKTLGTMKSQVEDAYNLESMNLKNKTSKGFVHLLFYYMLKDQNVGGQGSLLLDSGIALTDDDFEKLQSLDQVKRAFAAEKRTVGESRIVSKIAKYSPSAYDCFFGNAPSADQDQLKSRLALQKVKLIAYAEDYIKLLAKAFGDRTIDFLKTTAEVSDKNQNNKPLPYCFHESGEGKIGSLGIGKSYYKSAHWKDLNRSQARKNYVLGVFGFYTMLENHVGTFNLSGLPPFGANLEVDRAVLRGLIDGLVTQYWLTSMAYDVYGRRDIADTMDINLLSIPALRSMSNISVFFNPQRYWKAQGQNSNLLLRNKFKMEWEQALVNLAGDNYTALESKISGLESILDSEMIENPADMIQQKQQLTEKREPLDRLTGYMKFNLQKREFFKTYFKDLNDDTLKATIPTAHTGLKGNYYDKITELITAAYIAPIYNLDNKSVADAVISGYRDSKKSADHLKYSDDIRSRLDEAYPAVQGQQLTSAAIDQKLTSDLGLDMAAGGARAGSIASLKSNLIDAYSSALVSMKKTDPIVQADFNKSVVKALREIMKLIK